MSDKEQSAAILTIKSAAKMAKRGKRDIANWLRKQADLLESEGQYYSDGYRARYIYIDEPR